MLKFKQTTVIFRMAMLVILVSLATLASAQDYNYVSGTVPTNVVDSTHVDYVTVGATMPYSTDTTQSAINQWLSEISALGISPGTIGVSTKWYIGTDELAANVDAIQVQWNTAASYKLEVKTEITLNGSPSCDAAVSAKTVYVLPKPDFDFTDGDQAVLACNVTSHTFKFKVSGIGQKIVKYTVTRQAIGASETSDPQATQNVGTGVVSAGDFAETVKDYATASSEYNVATATETSVTVTGLAAGYIYKVNIDEISDQISRKSDITVNPTDSDLVFTVVPVPSATKINHIQNVE